MATKERRFKVIKEFSTQLADFAVGEILYLEQETRRVCYYRSLDGKKSCGILSSTGINGYLVEI